MKFDNAQLERIRECLLGSNSETIIRYMHAHGLAQATSHFGEDVEQTARELGWISGPAGELTEFGSCAADSCREYQFWIERDRALPFEAAKVPQLDVERFRAREVLEIGSGMGVNLMSLALLGVTAVGVEPVEAYTQLGALLCEREKMAIPEIRKGTAEALPFEDGAFDLVFCVSAHQYFDLKPALSEIARVLRPGGEILIIGGTLGAYIPETCRALISNHKALKPLTTTTLNTLSYTWIGRRIVPTRSRSPTARPIYPTRTAMVRLLRQAGLTKASDPVNVGPETCFHARLL